MPRTIEINRAPVLTLWAAVVAEHLGYNADEALTLGKAVAGLNAAAKGRALGIFTASQAREAGERAAPDETFGVPLLGREVPCMNTEGGIRATTKGKSVDPAKVTIYLEKRFGDSLADVKAAMAKLCNAYDDVLGEVAFGLYEQFRPEVARGQRGWGQKGQLDIDAIDQMAKPPEE
ncbi:MAG TPA: hypothetical protein QGH10_03765 [Armatimonadota bacterium]|nr:hypothetical protein [Armatimonadota bacterium]